MASVKGWRPRGSFIPRAACACEGPVAEREVVLSGVGETAAHDIVRQEVDRILPGAFISLRNAEVVGQFVYDRIRSEVQGIDVGCPVDILRNDTPAMNRAAETLAAEP